MTCTIKICGITNQEDLEMIAREGADYGGVIAGIPQSPRNLSLDTAKTLCSQTPLPLAALTFNKSVAENVLFAESLSPFALQLQGEETPDEVAALREQVSCEIWKALHLPPQEEGQPVDLSAYLARAHAFIAAGVDRFIIDTCTILDGVKRYGGTGKPVDWTIARQAREAIAIPVFLAGGIEPGNVAEAIRHVQPQGIDLCSKVERDKGKKDPELVRALIQNARQALA